MFLPSRRRLDQTVGAETSELLRNGRLPQTEYFFDLRYRLFLFDQQAENQQPRFMRQSLEETAGLMRAGNQRVDIEINVRPGQLSSAASYFTHSNSRCWLHKPPAAGNAISRHSPIGCAGLACLEDTSNTRRAPLQFLAEGEQKRQAALRLRLRQHCQHG